MPGMPASPSPATPLKWVVAAAFAVALGLFAPTPAAAGDHATPGGAENLETMLEAVHALTQMTSPSTGVAELDSSIIAALAETPRLDFLAAPFKNQPYANRAFRIGFGQWLNSPFIAAMLLQLSEVSAGERLLIAGLGAGYEAALAEHLGAEIYATEENPALLSVAKERVRHLGYGNLKGRHGAPGEGWDAPAPYAAIVLTTARRDLPQRLVDQLAPGGRLVMLSGDTPFDASLVRVTKARDGEIAIETLFPAGLGLSRRGDPT